MSTYLELVQRVRDDYVNRSDFTAEVKRHILAAVRFYERRRWRFNQSSTAIACSAGQSFVALPGNFLTEDLFRIESQGIDLLRRELPDIVQMRAFSATGIPTHYAIYGAKIELAVIPDSAYSANLYYLKTLSELSADTDTNGWTQGLAQDVIAYHAAKLMWANVIRNDAEAVKYAQLEADALSMLVSEHEQYVFTAITPTRF